MERVSAWVSTTYEGYAAVFRRAGLRYAQLAWAAAITAEWTFFVGVGVFAFEKGGTLGVGLVGLIRMLPSAAVGPFGSALGDRYRRDRVAFWLFVFMAAAAGGAALEAFTDPSALVIYALAGGAAAFATLSRSAQWALLPSLAGTPEELVAANGCTMTTENIGGLAGPVLGGLLLARASVGWLFVACAVTYLLAALAISQVRVATETRRPASAEGVVREVLGGFRALADELPAAFVIGLFCCQALVRGALNVFLVVVALRLIETGDSGVGFLTAALGAGGLVGAVGSLSLAGRRLALPFAGGLVFWSLPLAAIAVWPKSAVALVMVAVIGAANSVLDVSGLTLLQRLVPNEVLARVYGVLWGLATAAMGVGSIVTAGLIGLLGIRASLAAIGTFLPVVALLGWRRLAAADRSAIVPAKQLAALQGVPMLVHLSLVAKEEIAGGLVAIDEAPGSDLIRQGEAGDRFYILVEGEADVLRDGRAIAMRSAPDYFGEIALLRDVPRTATVRARSPVRLYALDRDAFLAAVTGHAAGREAGQAVVTERLATLPVP